MQKTRLIGAIGAALATALVVAGCSTGGAASSPVSLGPTKGDTDVKLAVIVANSNPWNTEYGKSFKAAAEQLGASDVRVLNADSDAQQQSEQIDSLLNAGYKGIGLNLAAPNTAELSKKFQAHDAYFANIFQNEEWKTVYDAPDDRQVSYVSPNYYKSASDATEALAKSVDGKKTELIALAGNDSPYTIANQAYLGLTDTLKKHSNITLVGNVDTPWTAENSQKKVADLLAAHPDATAFFATDAADVDGAVAAIRAIGKTPGKDIQIVSAHSAGDVAQFVEQGTVLAAAAMPGSWTGYQEAAQLFDALNGKLPGDSFRQLELTLPLITKDNAADFITRYVDTPIDRQLSARAISQVYSGDDWDLQAEYTPITDLPHLWPTSKEPSGYEQNATFTKLQESGALDDAAKTLQHNDVIDPFDPKPEFPTR